MLLVFDPERDRGRPWRTARPHIMRTPVINVRVDRDFQTDLASVPRWLGWLFPPTGLHQRAALFHDGMYALQLVDRRTADAIFASVLRNDGVPRWRRAALYLAVRLFGWRAWCKKTGSEQVSGGLR